MDLGDQIIEFLIEALQGPCFENQLELSRNKIVDFVKTLISLMYNKLDYLRRGFENKDSIDEINSLMTSSTQLLISLLEGNNNTEIKDLLCRSLDIQFLKQKLVEEYSTFLKEELNISTSASLC